MVSHIEVSLPEKPITTNNIGEAIKGPHKQIWKEYLFVKYDKKTIVSLFKILYQ